MPEKFYRIGFTSCARIRYKDNFDNIDMPCLLNEDDFQQPVWGHIKAHHDAHNFSAMLYLGDQIYTDYGVLNDMGGKRPRTWPVARFHNLLDAMYRAQYEKATGFKELQMAFKKAGTKIGMTWDDHDFGYNNGYGQDGPFINKLGSSKALFEQFLRNLRDPKPTYDAPRISIPTKTPSIGIEQITPPAFTNDSFEVVMLDGRFYRGKSLFKRSHLLGKDQWNQLRLRMENLPNNKLMIVCLGSTYSLSGQASNQSWKMNGNNSFYEFETFTQLANDKRIIFLSGDLHANYLEPHKNFCEIISSGAYLPGAPARFGVLDIYSDRTEVKLYIDNQIETKISQTIFRATGLPI